MSCIQGVAGPSNRKISSPPLFVLHLFFQPAIPLTAGSVDGAVSSLLLRGVVDVIVFNCLGFPLRGKHLHKSKAGVWGEQGALGVGYTCSVGSNAPVKQGSPPDCRPRQSGLWCHSGPVCTVADRKPRLPVCVAISFAVRRTVNTQKQSKVLKRGSCRDEHTLQEQLPLQGPSQPEQAKSSAPKLMIPHPTPRNPLKSNAFPRTFVIAEVRKVLPCLNCPMVPTFRWDLVRELMSYCAICLLPRSISHCCCSQSGYAKGLW
jgi:hypothetical protein